MDTAFRDLDPYMQQRGSPNVDTKNLGKRIDVSSIYFDEDGEVLAVWEKRRIHCNTYNEIKEETTENKWATEKKEREQKKKKPLGNCNVG